MATSRGRQDPPVASRLFDAGYEFNFFQAVRLLTHLSGGGGFSRLESPVQPSREVVRFDVHQSMAFPPSAIHRIFRSDPRLPVRMTVAFLGLTGCLGVLPHFYTEAIRRRARGGDTAGAAFLDIFNHRLISLFYAAWEKHHPFATWERANGAQPESGLPRYLLDLFGMGTNGLRGRLPMPDRTLLLYAGLLGQKPRSAAALAGMLRDYFGVPIAVEQFRGKWLTLAPEHRSCMLSDGVHNALGVGAIAGTAVWNQQARFRVLIGPLPSDRFFEFLPGGPAFSAVRHLTAFFVDEAMEFDVKLILRAAHVPECRLDDALPDAPRLGLASWLRTEAFKHDAGDTILESELTPRVNERAL